MKVIFWIATFMPYRQIQEEFQKLYGQPIGLTTIKYYRNHDDFQKHIQRIREKWGNELFHVELANKRRRMEELEKIYNHCVRTNQMKNALAALYQVQHEVEKELNSLSLTNYNINVYKDMTETELEEERVKSLERLKQLKGELPCLAVEKVENGNPENKES